MKTPSLEAIGLSLALATGCASNIGSVKPNSDPQCPQGTHLLVEGTQVGCARDLDVCFEVSEIGYIRKRCADAGKQAAVVDRNGVPMWECEK